jgi:hypothetical protein
VDTTIPKATITSPLNGTALRSDYVDVYYNCSDPDGLLKIEMSVDDHQWIPVHYGQTSGLGYERIKLADGRHILAIRATDYAGRQVTAFSAFSTNSDPLSPGGPYGAWPLVAIFAGIFSAVVYAIYNRLKSKSHPQDQSTADKSIPPPESQIMPPMPPEQQTPPQTPPQQSSE